MNTRQLAVAGSLLALLRVSTASAGLVPVLTGTTPGATTTFHYSLHFGDDFAASRLEPGDFLTIYDVPGYSFSNPAANFTLATALIGVNAAGTVPTDNPALFNVRWTYTGPTVTAGTIFPGFTIGSTLGGTQPGQFTAELTSVATGTTISEIGPVLIPATPEPSTLALLALATLATVYRRRS